MNILVILLSTLFLQANVEYAEGNYAQAAQTYQEILQDSPCAEVYYNLVNAHFKQGELAQAILAYERALRLQPSMKDAKYNLQFAQSCIVDNIEDTNAFFLSDWLRAFRNLFSQSTWMIISIVLFVLMLCLVFVFAFSAQVALRKTAFSLAIIALVISFIALLNARSLHQRDTMRTQAIITQGIVNAKASPDRSGTDLFTLHEGTKVEIQEVIGTWCRVQVGNNIGWMPLEWLERI
jgi:tetratricopeptide (TPR) repeat protein